MNTCICLLIKNHIPKFVVQQWVRPIKNGVTAPETVIEVIDQDEQDIREELKIKVEDLTDENIVQNKTIEKHIEHIEKQNETIEIITEEVNNVKDELKLTRKELLDKSIN